LQPSCLADSAEPNWPGNRFRTPKSAR
jgi:hypothetical protein